MKHLKQSVLLIFVAFVCSFTHAYNVIVTEPSSDSGSLSGETSIAFPTSISLNYYSVSLQVGGSWQLSAIVSPSGASQSVMWSVPSGSSYVSVSSSGLVTAKAAGTAIVRVTSTVNSSLCKDCIVTVSNPTEIAINATNFPDENFRNYLLQQGYGQDGVLTEEEILGIKNLDVWSKSINSLNGIEYFTALTDLYCGGNKLTSLDVSKNTALVFLSCGNNQLTSLDVSKNTALTLLECGGNKLSSLDVSKNVELTYLACGVNQLTSLDVSMNSALTGLICEGNLLSVIDVSKNKALTSLRCCNLQLTALDLSNNSMLTTLICSSNIISGANMDNLINSLPVREATNQGEIYVINLSDASEGNVCTKSQVAALKAKGWIAKYDDVNAIPSWGEYEGSEDIAPLVFTAEIANGVVMTFKISDEQAKTCQIGDGLNPAVSTELMGQVVLPIFANGYSVTAVAASAFKGTSIGTVHIPNTIRAIGDSAFANCSWLDEVCSYIEAPFDIPSNAFSGINSRARLEIIYGSKDKYFAATGWNTFAAYDESMYFIDGIRYSVDGAEPTGKGEPYTAWVKSSKYNLYEGDVVIPETFNIGDETFTVVGIDDGAFNGSFINSVTIPGTVRSIDDRAFADCIRLQMVRTYIMEPKDENSSFVNVPVNATLYVPQGTKVLYEALGGWSMFSNIVEMEETAIQEFDDTVISQMEDASKGMYNLGGRRILQPMGGVYIKDGKKMVKY